MARVPVKVKICGICRPEDARAAVDAGADFLGLNFHPPSPRHVDLERAAAIAAAVPGTPLVGVFVDTPRAEVERIAAAVGLAALQFHGDEDPDYCTGWPWRTIKALRARAGVDLAAEAAAYPTDYLLVDSYQPGRKGGTGVALDPSLALGLPRDRLFVAGGIRPDTVADIVTRLRPFAVDVASGVEHHPREKDHAQLRDFVRRAKSA
jgi:phosphoribosylanthranilate isomerase